MSKKPEMQPRPLDVTNTPGAFDLQSLLRREAEAEAISPVIPDADAALPPPRRDAPPSARPKTGRQTAANEPASTRSHSIRLTLPHAIYRELSLLSIDSGRDRQALVIEGIETVLKKHQR